MVLVWRGIAENSGSGNLEALRVGRDLPMPPPGAPGPFAQSDPATVKPMLAAAGWSDIAFEPIDQLVWLGPDAHQGTGWQLGQSAWLLRGPDEDQRAKATANLHALLRPETPAASGGLGSLDDHRPSRSLNGGSGRPCRGAAPRPELHSQAELRPTDRDSSGFAQC